MTANAVKTLTWSRNEIIAHELCFGTERPSQMQISDFQTNSYLALFLAC